MMATAWLVLVAWQVIAVLANYRHINLENHDVCEESKILPSPAASKKIAIGTGAIIFELSKPRMAFHARQDKSKLCKIHVKAPEGFGIMAYVQDAYMRRNRTDKSCKDYVQFGQDDRVPFITVKKSVRVCGRVEGDKSVDEGFSYDDPHGNLLIWINLWGRKETTHWPHINTVHLTLVVTSYQANCGRKSLLTGKQTNPGPGFTMCEPGSGKCISKNYFCDRRINCALDRRPKDEADCDYESVTTDGSDSDKSEIGDKSGDVAPSSGINLISLALIIVAVICFALALVVVVSYQRRCCRSQLVREDDNGQVQNLAELSAHRPMAEQNIYLPLNAFGATPANATFEEPPPTYEELYPRQRHGDQETALA